MSHPTSFPLSYLLHRVTDMNLRYYVEADSDSNYIRGETPTSKPSNDQNELYDSPFPHLNHLTSFLNSHAKATLSFCGQTVSISFFL